MRLFGAAEALRDATAGALTFPAIHALYDSDVAAARRQLEAGDFTREWAHGRALTLDAAIVYALEGGVG